MNSKANIIWGFIITVAIFILSNILGSIIKINSDFIPSSFITHSVMLVLSIIAIVIMNKYFKFRITLPEFKKIFKPFFIGVLITIVVNILMSVIIKLAGGEIVSHPMTPKMNALQLFLFVFLLASIAEEILFRGFFQNSLKSLKDKGIKIFKIRFSLPVIISSIVFGLAHLILISAGMNYFFLIRIVLFTSILGLFAGYYQEKYDNTSYAILVHMGGNLPALLSTLMMSMQ